MKYLDKEDKEKLHELGTKILQTKKLMQEITEFFVTNVNNGEPSQANYYGTEELLNIVNLFIKGESLDYIGEQVLQDDGKQIRKVLRLMDIDEK